MAGVLGELVPLEEMRTPGLGAARSRQKPEPEPNKERELAVDTLTERASEQIIEEVAQVE